MKKMYDFDFELDNEEMNLEEVPSSKEERRMKESKRRKSNVYKQKQHEAVCKQIALNEKKRTEDSKFPKNKKNGELVTKKSNGNKIRYKKEAKKMGII